MKHSISAALALLASSALATSIGSAIVVNSCDYEVYLDDVPSSGGGYESSSTVLAEGGSWSQTYTELSNGNGWSIKLGKTEDASSIMQFEYTYQGDDVVWFDISDVNGNPWEDEWEISSNLASCVVSQIAYMNSTDNAAMQPSCDVSVDVTVTLCESLLDDSSSSSTAAASTTAASTTAEAASTTAAAETTPSTTAVASTTSATEASSTTSAAHTHHYGEEDEVAVASTSATPTTFATSTTAAVVTSEGGAGVTVWEVETAVVTEVVTALYTAPSRLKRHEHHAAHQHRA